MINLTPTAQQRLEQYLHQIHLVLSRSRSVSAEDVERDIREHIEQEFQARAEVVSLDELDPVLERLGSPNQWLPQEELPWWQRFLVRLRSGPEDWRLAYLALALFVLGIIFWIMLPGLLVPLILGSYLVSRASLESSRERNEELGAQKWFLYPSLLLVDAVLLLLVLFGPLILAGGLGYELRADFIHRNHAPPDFKIVPQNEVAFVIAVVVTAATVWWLILGIVLWLRPEIAQVVFRPFAEPFKGKHGRCLFCLGTALGILGGIALVLRVA
jgi:hypothetical protein